MEDNIKNETQLKLNYSFKGALLVHKYSVLSSLVVLAICIYFVISSAGNEEKSTLLFKFWIPFLVVSIVGLFCSLCHVFALTRNNKSLLFFSLFPLQILHCLLSIGWFGYLIAFCLSVFNITEAFAIFLLIIFCYIIVDSFMVFLLLTSLLSKAKPLTTFLCKYWFIREALLLFVSFIIFCFYAYLLVNGHVSVLNILFLILCLIQVIILSIYMKIRYCKPKTWEPKPLEAKLSEKKMINDAFLIMAAMEEDKEEAAGAA